MSQLLVYTGRNRKSLSTLRHQEFFIYPFSHIISRTKHDLGFFKCRLISETVNELSLLLNQASAPADAIKWFAETADQRSVEIERLSKSLNRRSIYLFWSGGIDSTAALVGLLKNFSREARQRITIVLTVQSALENPGFYLETVSPLKKLNYFEAWPRLLSDPDALIVTGELGDQIMGAGMLLSSYKEHGSDFLQADYLKHGPTVLSDFLKNDSRRSNIDTKTMFEFLLPIAEESPVPIRTVFDFFWWFNFTQEWQFAKMKFLETVETPLAPNLPLQVQHFFDTKGFQLWSMATLDQRLPKSWKDYKRAAKLYIDGYSKTSTAQQLIKRQSLKHTYFLQKFRLGVSTNFESIDQLDDLARYVRA